MKSKISGRSRTLSTTLAIVFAFMSMATIIISGGFGMFFLFQSQQDAIAGMQRVVAHQAANTVAGFIQRKFSVMEAAVRLSRSGKERKRAMQVLIGMQPAFRQLLLLNTQNRELFRVSRMSQRESLRLDRQLDLDLFSKVQDGNRYIGSVYVDQVTSEPLIIMAVPTKSIIGDILGVLVAEVNLKFMWDLVDRLDVGETGYAYVVDRDGLLIAFGDTGRVLKGETLADLKNVSEFMQHDKDRYTAGVDISTGIAGTTVVGTYVPLKMPDWAVITELPVNEAYRPVLRSAMTSAGILLAMAILAALIGALVARRLAVPLLKLADTATRIESGEMELKAQMDGPTEVTRLAEAFNNMTERLRIMLDDEEEQNRKLTQEVKQRKKIEQALRESEERLDLALDAANEGIWDWDVEHSRMLFDDRYYTMAGYRPGAFPGAFKEWEKRVHPDDIESTETAIKQYLAGKSDAFDVEFRFLREEGHYMWIRGKGKIVDRKKDGSPSRFIGTHSDVTDRKQAEIALQENERLLTNILESMDEGVMVLNRDFEYQIFNRKLENISNTPRATVIGKKPWDVFPNLKNSEIEKRFRNTMNGEMMGSMEIKLPTPHTNEEKWLRDQVTALRDTTGHISGVVAVLRDITQEKEAEEKLHRLQNYLSNIIDSMPSVIVGVDGDGRVTLWNQTVAQKTGITAGTARGKSLSDVFPQMNSEMAKISESIQSRRLVQTKKKPCVTDGEICYEDLTIYPLITDGVKGAVIRIDDVTEQVRLEEMMIQSEKMLSVGGLAAGMAHEINNPLAGILQNSAVLYNRLFGDLPDNHQAAAAAGTTMAAIGKYLESRKLIDMLDNIRSSGHRAAAIVRNMLSFARKSDRATSSNDLRALLDQTIALVQTDYDMKKKYDFKHIKIVKEYDEPLPLVLCDGSKLQQVFLNILKNGAEAMAETAGAQRPSTFILRVQDDDRWVRVEIEDNGPGMNDKTRRSIFDPFFTTKPVGKGTGLGLSVSYFIITEDHGGELGAYAAESGGTRFVIRLPKAGKQVN